MNKSLLIYPGSPKYASIAASSSGANTIVAAVTGKRILVLSLSVVAAADVAMTWKSASTVISGEQSFPANGGRVLNHNPTGWFVTAAGEALVLTLGGAVSVGGELVYQVID